MDIFIKEYLYYNLWKILKQKKILKKEFLWP